MSFGKSSPPPPPDYNAAAKTQGAANVEAARTAGRMGNPNISSPAGGQRVTWGPDDQPNVEHYLSPQYQDIFNQNTQLQRGLAGLGNKALDYSSGTLGTPINMGAMPPVSGGGDLAARRQQVQDALYQRQARYLDPQWSRAQENTETTLANQGFMRGTPGWNRAMDDFERQRGVQYAGARDTAIAGGTAEEQHQYGLESANRQRAIQEVLMQRAQPLNEISAFRSGSQIQMPQGQDYRSQGVAAAPMFDAASQQHQAALTGYGIQAGQENAFMNGLMQMGGMAAMGYGMRPPGR